VPVKDASAVTTVLTFVTQVGIPKFVVLDRDTAFTSAFSRKLCVFLTGIKHIMSATAAARTNGLCENLVKRAAESIKLYAKNDLDQDSLPII